MPIERTEAPRLYRVLQKVCEGMAPAEGMHELASSGWQPDYLDVRRRSDLAPAHAGEAERVVLGAARLGATRLIDSVEF